MTNILTAEPKQFISLTGTLVPHIFKLDGQVLCDFRGIAILLKCSPLEALQIAKKYDRVSALRKQYMTADDFAFLVDELPEAPPLAKELAKKIHRTSETALLSYFLFDYQK